MYVDEYAGMPQCMRYIVYLLIKSLSGRPFCPTNSRSLLTESDSAA